MLDTGLGTGNWELETGNWEQTNSSNIKQFFARFIAASFSSGPTSSGYSSRKVRMEDGSIPIRGLFSVTRSFNLLTFLLASFVALRIKPFER
jgi:hypothetical protein